MINGSDASQEPTGSSTHSKVPEVLLALGLITVMIGIFVGFAIATSSKVTNGFESLTSGGQQVEAVIYDKKWTGGRYSQLKFTYVFDDNRTVTENISLRGEDLFRLDSLYEVGDSIVVCQSDHWVAGDFTDCGEGAL